MLAILVPSGDYAAEKEILSRAKELEHVKSATGLAGIEIEEGHTLTDEYTPRMLSMLLGIDYEQAALLIAYRVSDVYIGHIGLAVGRGALISVILVMTVLPQLIVLMDGLIRKTTFKTRAKTETGGEAS